jgi:hypothetical protein
MNLEPIRKAKSAAKKNVARRQAPRAQSVSASFFEALEVRQLLSSAIAPAVSLAYVNPDAKGSSSIQGYTPAEIKAAYGFTGVSETGAGQTIAIIDAYNDPNIASDLGTFDSAFGLAAPPSFKIVSQTGSSTLPATNASWAQETSLDVEWAHAIAPQANILLVEATSDSTTNLLKAVNYARSASGVSVVSMSWGGGETSNETADDKYFTTPSGHIGVTFVAAAGDEGAQGGAEWPASSPNVVAVGGTTLSLSGSTYESETTWSETSDGTSEYESTPTYQSSLGVTGRTTADVSYDADPDTGFATYDSLSYQGEVGWAETGGTSAGTPQWGALIALADQGRVSAGSGTLDGATGTLPALYGIYANSTTYADDFNDITSGSNGSEFGGGGFGGGFGGGGFGGHHGHGRGGYSYLYGGESSAATSTTGVSLTSATSGYDGPTGLGTPKAAGLVSSLISFGESASAKKAAVVKSISPAIVRIKPALRVEQAPPPPQAAYVAVATPAETPVLNRPEPLVELDTAEGLARPSTSAAATADSSVVQTPAQASTGSLSGFISEATADAVLAKVASALKPAAQSAVAAASTVLVDAQQAAAKLAASTAPFLVAPQQVFTLAHVDANAALDEAINSFTDELASIPRAVGVTHSNAWAWSVTGIVIAADVILIARYRMKRAVFNQRMKIAC